MCGITGIVGDGWDERELLVRNMARTLRHRGPDDEGIETLGHASLGARRLAILDLVGGHQPLSNEDGSIIAIQNGEIYNFEELRDDLRRRGHTFTTTTDTEVVPHAYEEFGEEFVTHLRGMFALAVWDDRRSKLILARDRVGKKPLNYMLGRSSLAFASEIQALLTLSSDRAVDDEAIREYLTFGYVRAPRTAFRQIRKVQPGHVLTFESGEVRERAYWHPRFVPKRQISEAEALERLEAELLDAVRLRLISDVPLGAFLSGGLDSSTVVAMMARVASGPVRTFSIGFGAKDYDELRYARMVAEAFGTDHSEYVVAPEAAEVLPMLVRHVGEPFADSSIVPTFYVAKIAREKVTVALNGDGGDELFAGYERHRGMQLAHALERVPPVLRRMAAGSAGALPSVGRWPRTARRARLFAMTLPLSARDRYQRWMGYLTDPEMYGERVAAGPVDYAWDQALANSGAEGPVDRLLAIDLLNYLPGDLLVKVDIASMASSLEARSPFLDHRLIEFVATLPESMKLHGRDSKYLLRRLMMGVLPEPILTRPKMGFGVPVGDWMRGPLRELVLDVVVNGPDRGYVRGGRARAMVDQHLSGTADHTPAIWSLLMLELWFRLVVEQRAGP